MSTIKVPKKMNLAQTLKIPSVRVCDKRRQVAVQKKDEGEEEEEEEHTEWRFE